MQAMVDMLILLGLLLALLVLLRSVPWLQKIWMRDGKFHSIRFMLMIASLLIVKDVISKVFGGQIIVWLTSQGIGFGMLYVIYALLIIAMAVKLTMDDDKIPQTSPRWLRMLIRLSILVMMLFLPFW